MDAQEVVHGPDGSRLRTRLRVRLAETDAQGVVYYGSFFAYFEVGRLGLLRAAGFDLARPWAEGSFYIVAAACDYKSFARYNDRLLLETRVGRIGRSSVKFEHELWLEDDEGEGQGQGRLCARAHDTLVWLDAAGRPAPLPEQLRDALAGFLSRRVLWSDGRPRGWRVVVGSENPTKVAAARAVFERIDSTCTVTGCAVAGGVPAQPWGHHQTRAGAIARAQAALAQGGDLGLGMEGGLREGDGGVYVISWCAALDRHGRLATAGGVELPLPPRLAGELRGQGGARELGPVIDRLAGQEGFSRQRGAIGLLTAGLVDRGQVWEQALAAALAPWLREDLYGGPGDRGPAGNAPPRPESAWRCR